MARMRSVIASQPGESKAGRAEYGSEALLTPVHHLISCQEKVRFLNLEALSA